MKEEKANLVSLWMGVSFVLAISFLLYYNGENKRIVKAIQQHDIDTIWANDSIYVIKYKIDTVIYDEHAHDFDEKPDRN